MEDTAIIELYFSRCQTALKETEIKYGRFIYSLANNILSSAEDTEECVNDTYLRLWNSIPPNNPGNFIAYIGKITRNTAVSILRHNTAAKRNSSGDVLLSELEDCIPSRDSINEEADMKYLSEIISGWLKTLDPDMRVLFVKRYWYGESVQELSMQTGIRPAKISSYLFSLRKKLKKVLEEKGVRV